MWQSSQYVYLLVLTILILSSNLIQCQKSEKFNTVQHDKRSLRNIDYINMCIFRKTRLCDFLRELGHIGLDVRREDRGLPKRKPNHFYSNW